MTAETTFRMPGWLRIGNAFTSVAIRLGLPAGPNELLTVRGRASGLPRTTPVAVVEHDGDRFLLSPYGVTNWVRNLRANSEASLRRGRRKTGITAVELAPADAVPVLRGLRSMMNGPLGAVIGSRFKFPVDDDAEAWETEARRHPTFRIIASGDDRPLADPGDG